MKQATPVTNDAGPEEAGSVVLREAGLDDVRAIADVWQAGWWEAHRGQVPDALLAHRGPSTFPSRAADRTDRTVVAVSDADDSLAGFVTVTGDEVEQLYLDRARRGRGIADLLLVRAEQDIAQRFDAAWLAVVAGNQRARRFYERCGWVDTGPFDNPADTTDGAVLVPCRRYEKDLTSPTGARP